MSYRNVSLITMGQGNPVALERTLSSFSEVCNEVIFGDLLIFGDDREIIKTYQDKYNLKFVPFPFNYIYKNGFSATLNEIAHHANNDLVLYMNVGEVIGDEEERILRIINELATDCNCFAFDHAIDKHTWYRLYDKNEIHWEGLIHEELQGEKRPFEYYLFRMSDTQKDMQNAFRAKVYNDIKEIVYFNQYIKLVEQPELIGVTNSGWVDFAKGSYKSLKDRMRKKGKRVEAFENGDLAQYLHEIENDEEFKLELQKSSNLIHLQGDASPLL